MMTYLAYFRELFRNAPPPLSKAEADARDENLARKAAFAAKGWCGVLDIPSPLSINSPFLSQHLLLPFATPCDM